MKTTTYIIGDKEFSLEDSATKKLDYYRTAIADHFSGQDTEEAINDIDLAIIEKLEAKLKKRTDKTIILSDIEELIRQLGTIEQITDQTEQGEDTIIVSKKLFNVFFSGGITERKQARPLSFAWKYFY